MQEAMDPKQLEQAREQLLEFGSVPLRTAGGTIRCLAIVGQIEGHQQLPENIKTTKYEHVIPQLAAMEADPEVEGVLLLLNTVGGDIEAGLALAELIAGMKTPTASLVLGGGHSIGVPLAVSASRSFIVPSASVTIHPVRFPGVVIGVPQTFDYFRRVSDRIVRFITDHSRVSAEKFTEYMTRTGELTQDVGSVLDGQEAVACGLIDRLGGLSDALEYLHGCIRENGG